MFEYDDLFENDEDYYRNNHLNAANWEDGGDVERVHWEKRVYYKLVASRGNGRYYSIFDGETEYAVGKVLSQKVRENHGGGFYVCESLEDLLGLGPMPASCRLKESDWAIAKVLGWGDYRKYSNCKISIQYIKPLSFRPFYLDKTPFIKKKRRRKPTSDPSGSSRMDYAIPGRKKPGLVVTTADIDRHEDRLKKRQADNLKLEEEIQRMEERLAAMKGR